MRRFLYTLVLALPLFILSCASFPTDFTDYQTLAYGGLLIDGDTYELKSISILTDDWKHEVYNSHIYIKDNEFVIHSIKPGKYLIDEIDIDGPAGFDVSLMLFGDKAIRFEVKENGVTNVFSSRCEVSNYFVTAKVTITETGPDVDKVILKDLIEKAENSTLQKIFSDYYDAKYGKYKINPKTNINNTLAAS